MKSAKNELTEHNFSLLACGLKELGKPVEDALFDAGCNDATLSMRHGLLYAEFSRDAESLESAILTAIRDIRKAKVGVDVLRVDDCDLVSPSDIARRISRSRQLVHQYMTGKRGPGTFPPPVAHLKLAHSLWDWCTVSRWLADNDIIREEDSRNAEVICAINTWLASERLKRRNPALMKQVVRQLQTV